MKYKVRNKTESYRLIEQLELNTFPYKLFDEYDESKLREFLETARDKYNCDGFGARSLKELASRIITSTLYSNAEELIERTKGLRHFAAYGFNNESDSSQYLSGEVEIVEPYSMELAATVSTDPKDTARSALYNPSLNINGSLLHDQKLKHLVRRTPGLEYVIDFMMERDLVNVAMEFALCKQPIGTKNEQLAVFELRTDY